VTWEWEHQLRSSLHPLLFAAIYKFTDLVASALSLPAATRADLLIAGPKTAQAVVSAVGDFYTWKLANRVYGDDSRGAWTALFVTVLSPWQFFCSTRTLSNCLETTLTIVALDLWPWKWSAGAVSDDELSKSAADRRKAEDQKLLWRYENYRS
jgi:phosphatidylinositol glycan class B